MTRIRPMREADADRVAALTTQLGYPVAPDELTRRLAEVRRHDDHELLVAVDPEDAAIGWIHVARHTGLEVADQAIIHGLVVDESARSGGIGNELVEAAEAWARSTRRDHHHRSLSGRAPARASVLRAHRLCRGQGQSHLLQVARLKEVAPRASPPIRTYTLVRPQEGKFSLDAARNHS